MTLLYYCNSIYRTFHVTQCEYILIPWNYFYGIKDYMLTYMHLMLPCSYYCFSGLILVFHRFTTRLSFWFVLFKWKIFEAVPCRHNKNHSGERAFLFMWLKNVYFGERNKRYNVANIYAIMWRIKMWNVFCLFVFLSTFMRNIFWEGKQIYKHYDPLNCGIKKMCNPFLQ